MVTDLHYADKPSAGSRHYRETLRKFDEASQRFASDNVEFVVELGDFIDAADSLEIETAYLTAITKRFAATPGKHHYVLGNREIGGRTFVGRLYYAALYSGALTEADVMQNVGVLLVDDDTPAAPPPSR